MGRTARPFRASRWGHCGNRPKVAASGGGVQPAVEGLDRRVVFCRAGWLGPSVVAGSSFPRRSITRAAARAEPRVCWRLECGPL